MDADLPGLWLDWCNVTGVQPRPVDDIKLAAFTSQIRAPHRVLATLHAQHQSSQLAPAWPGHHHDHPSLDHVLLQLHAQGSRPDAGWVSRLQTRRLSFVAVTVAPRLAGGLALTRAQALLLSPAALMAAATRIGTADEPSACPMCAVWVWVEILGTNKGWGQASLKALVLRQRSRHHRHNLADVGTDWLTCPSLLPRLDRWGWLDHFTGIHPSSLSGLIAQVARSVAEPIDHNDAPEPQTPRPRPIVEHSPARLSAAFAQADQINARIEALLREYGE